MGDDDNLPRRVSALEQGMAAMQAQLAASEHRAAEHRAEEKAMLTKIVDKVESIAAEQLLERGRREGAAGTWGSLGTWGRAGLVLAAGIALYLLSSFIEDAAPPPPPTIIVRPPATVREAAPAMPEKEPRK